MPNASPVSLPSLRAAGPEQPEEGLPEAPLGRTPWRDRWRSRAGALAEWWARSPAWLLSLLTALLSVVQAVEAVEGGVWRAASLRYLVCGLVASALLAARRRHPVLVLLLVSLVQGPISPAGLYPATHCAQYGLGRRVRSLPVLIGCAALSVLARPLWMVYNQHSILELGLGLVQDAWPVMLGYAVARRREVAAHWQERSRLASEDARLRERQRIAREMHDTVAHRVGNMTLFADALALRLPEAGSQLGTVREQGRAALTELRELLGLLRSEAAAAVEARPLDRLLDDLVAAHGAAGHDVDYARTGTLFVPSAHRHATYRIVQEALTNAAKHAPGTRAVLRVDHDGDRLAVTVDTPPPPARAARTLPGGGHGLTGLAERVSLLHGTLTTRRHATGAFTLAAVLPVPAAPEEESP
ncbi:histidine kinase [Streptomyces sp. NPDC001941]|uniref:sensor histidine kinase n=1 Tax=Streptomyces sp. NPDC001941 TaxID=3154659 RepID=UPI0033331DD6